MVEELFTGHERLLDELRGEPPRKVRFRPLQEKWATWLVHFLICALLVYWAEGLLDETIPYLSAKWGLPAQAILINKWYAPNYFGRGSGYYHFKVNYYDQEDSGYSAEAQTDYNYYSSVNIRHPIPVHYLPWFTLFPSLDDSPPTLLSFSIGLFLLIDFYLVAPFFILRKLLIKKNLIAHGKITLGKIVEIRSPKVFINYESSGKVYRTSTTYRFNYDIGNKVIVLIDNQNPKKALVYDGKTILKAQS